VIATRAGKKRLAACPEEYRAEVEERVRRQFEESRKARAKDKQQ